MLQLQYATWPENTSNIHHMVDTSRPWAPSPEAELFPLPTERVSAEPVIPSLHQRCLAHRKREDSRRKYVDGDPFRERNRSWTAFLHSRWFGKKSKTVQRDIEKWPSYQSEMHIVHPAEWRAYGYWARPTINGVTAGLNWSNLAPPPVPRDLSRAEVEEVFRALRDSHDNPRPENWIPRLQHPSLPPRPSLWPTPSPSLHPLPPTEIQLNPFLRHRLVGRPPILFDMRVHQCLILLGELPAAEGDDEPWRVPFFSEGPNGSQPATYPPVSSLHISALADDTFAQFPWPMTVIPHHPSLPVQVKHVLNACIANFEERMTQEEVDALSDERKRQTFRTYWERVRSMVAGRIPGDDDGLRRIDYLGDRAFFRGLEPAPDGDGFMLFVGPP